MLDNSTVTHSETKTFHLKSLPSPLIVQGTFVSFGGTISKQSTQHVLYCSIAHGGGAPHTFWSVEIEKIRLVC